MGEAPNEVHSYLTNLRTELLEERASIQMMKKQARKHQKLLQRQAMGHGNIYRVDTGAELDEVTLKTMGDMVKHLIKKFEKVEAPFLEPGHRGIADATNHRRRRRASRSASPYQHAAYASSSSPPEKRGGRARSRTDHDREGRLPRYRTDDEEDDERYRDRYWAQRTRYADYSFVKRLRWIAKKPEAQDLIETLARVQTRRIARQVNAIGVLLHEYGSSCLEMEETIRRMDERMGRFLGVRRVDGDGND